jgi:hypothetical protein
LRECLEHLEASYRLLAQAHELSEPSSTEIGTGKVSIVHTGKPGQSSGRSSSIS